MRYIMKLINTDFSDIENKTIFDFADEEAIERFTKNDKSLSPSFFSSCDNSIRFQYLTALADLILMSNKEDKDALKLKYISEKKLEDYEDFKSEQAKNGVLVD